MISCLNMVEGGAPEQKAARRTGKYRLEPRASSPSGLDLQHTDPSLPPGQPVDQAIATAREAVEIGTKKLEDKYLAAINRIGLGNALRQSGDLRAASKSFKEASREANAIKNISIDGFASRLLADTLVEMAEEGAPFYRSKLYGEAEQFATYAVGLLRGSIADDHHASALESRGDARCGLGRKDEGFDDYAEAARLFASHSPDDAKRLIRNLVANIDLERPDKSIGWFEKSYRNTRRQVHTHPRVWSTWSDRRCLAPRRRQCRRC